LTTDYADFADKSGTEQIAQKGTKATGLTTNGHEYTD